MEQPVELRYVWTAEELFAATRWHYRRILRPAFRIGIHCLAGLFLLIGLLGPVVFLDRSVPRDIGGEIAVAGTFALGLGWFVGRRPLLRWLVNYNFARRPDQNREVDVKISRERIVFKSCVAEGSFSWAAFFKVVGTPDGLLLYTLENLFVWLPRRLFANEADYDKVVQITMDAAPRFYTAQ